MEGRISRFFFCLVISVFCLTGNEAKISDSLKVQLPHGGGVIGRYFSSFRGHGIRAFMGIPYAEAPIGNLRFHDPVPKRPWIGFKETTSNKVVCSQIYEDKGMDVLAGKEDCLYLDVYVPQYPATDKLLSIMVFFHGGGWNDGSASFYGPQFFLDHDVILVIGNYRLNALGFLTTNTTASTGNYGFKDQVETLNWIQQNIVAFGGNKEEVTIFGESAGGASVTYLMEFAAERGLFHRAIAQSGTYFDSWARVLDTATIIERTKKYTKELRCSLVDEKWDDVIECLREKPIYDLMISTKVLNIWGSNPLNKFPPTVEYDRKDGFITDYPENIKENPSTKIPLMIGINKDEGVLQAASILGNKKYRDDLEVKWSQLLPLLLDYDYVEKEKQRNITDAITNFYFEDTSRSPYKNPQNIIDLFTDFTFFKGFNKYLRFRFEDESVAETFVYFFTHSADGTFSDFFFKPLDINYGVSHCDELLYLFPLLHKAPFKSAPNKEDILVQETLVKLWVNFATTGKPTPAGSVDFDWTPTKKFPLDYLRIGSYKEPNKTIFGMETDLWRERTEFLKNIF
uniref:Carboxylic ester hydrolase n=1 Tax=Nyssomyia neivai TaxID=330878 RepID=A0A1L8DJ66_9DIPT